MFLSLLHHSCELSSRLFAKFDKLAANINARDDVKLGHVNCEADSEFCDTNGVKGTNNELWICLHFVIVFTHTHILMTVAIDSGLAVFFYPEDKERIQFNGVKSEEGLSKFLIKNLGDTILVRMNKATG